MTSKQVMPTLALLLCLGACSALPKQGADPLVAPYGDRKVWAIAPLRNESGSLGVDAVRLADHLARQLEGASHIDVLPVNRTLAAMEALRLPQVTNPGDAQRLMALLQVDALVVGSVSAYDPYDPPKLGLAIELYTSERRDAQPPTDVRALSSAATDRSLPSNAPKTKQPASVVSAFFDAADPEVRRKIERYAGNRRVRKDTNFTFERHPEEPWRLYNVSMDLYSEFVSYVVSWRLLRAESIRLGVHAPATTQPVS